MASPQKEEGEHFAACLLYADTDRAGLFARLLSGGGLLWAVVAVRRAQGSVLSQPTSPLIFVPSGQEGWKGRRKYSYSRSGLRFPPSAMLADINGKIEFGTRNQGLRWLLSASPLCRVGELADGHKGNLACSIIVCNSCRGD